jgi:mitogen-activated protein kinase 15
MIVGKPVFPGTSTLDQLERVMEITGRPLPDDVEAVKSPFANQMLDSVQPQRHKSLEDIMPKASVQAIDFLKRCFQFNPDKRSSAAELLAHPYLSQFHDAAKEPDCSRTIDIPLDDNVRLTIKDYREKLYEEISKRRAQNKEEQSSTPSTPPQMNVPSTQGVTKQYSYRASNLTPTTCHTNTGHSTPNTPGTSKTTKVMRSPPSVAPVPYRTAATVAGPKSPKSGAKPRAGSILRSTSVNPTQGARAVLARPPSAARLIRTPSSSSLLARARAASPAAGKRPTTSYYR